MSAAALAFTLALMVAASAPSAQQKIVFVGGGAEAEIYSVNADGTGLERLTDREYMDATPSWSPDGRRIAFVASLIPSNVFGPTQNTRVIRIMNADGTSLHDVSGRIDAAYPTWSPDGRRIAYARYERLRGDWVHVMNNDGSGDVRIAYAPGGYAAPDWSPDGRWIAFPAFAGGRSQIHAVRPDGSGLRVLVRSTWHDVQPAWSPDGRRLAFAGFRSGRTALFIVNADGKNRVSLTQKFGFHGSDPDWSRDGRRIVYSCWRGGVCIGDLRTGKVRVVARVVNGRGPDWQPQPRN